jgi:hypothetical protein
MKAPSFPSFRPLPIEITMDGLIGYFYDKLSQTADPHPHLTAVIFAIRPLAITLFYHTAQYVLRGKDLQSHKIFLGTLIVINMTFLFVLKELNMIGRLFSCLFGLAFLGQLIYRVRYIQNEERKLILNLK